MLRNSIKKEATLDLDQFEQKIKEILEQITEGTLWIKLGLIDKKKPFVAPIEPCRPCHIWHFARLDCAKSCGSVDVP